MSVAVLKASLICFFMMSLQKEEGKLDNLILLCHFKFGKFDSQP
jgi:hypothetical protein